LGISLNAPFGNCRLEYVAEIEKLKTDYGYLAAKHPMVGIRAAGRYSIAQNDEYSGRGVGARGIAQGSDLRPPLGIEIGIRNGEILADRME